MFDVTFKNISTSVKKWHQVLIQVYDENIPIVVCENKIDMQTGEEKMDNIKY